MGYRDSLWSSRHGALATAAVPASSSAYGSETDVRWSALAADWRWMPDDVIHGTPFNDDLHGTAGDDVMDGGEGFDQLRGKDGNDTLIGDAGHDVLFGGDGNDLLTVATTSGDELWGDQLNGGAGNDTLLGSADDEILTGGKGNDSMAGEGGNDGFDLTKSGEADTIDGGSGNDQVDVQWGKATHDIVWVNDPTTMQVVNGLSIVNVENVSAILGSGNDTLINLEGSFGTVYGNDGNDYITGDILWGDAGNDTLVGSSDAEMYGGDGNDVLMGSGGDDLMYGKRGLDELSGGGGDDTLNGAATWDAFEAEADTFNGGDGIDYLVAQWSAATDSMQIRLNANTHVLYDDQVSGVELFNLGFGSGNDTVVAGASDTIDGGAGNDVLRNGAEIQGGLGDDTLVGDAGSDRLSDYSGNNRMIGGTGNDTLESSHGESTMSGGAGADRFLASADTTDLVLDFSVDSDTAVVNRFLVGNHDLAINGATTKAGPGGFSANAELVVITADIAGDITADAAAAAIGSATGNYSEFSGAIFVVDNGIDTAVYVFDSSASDAVVSAAELNLLFTLQGVAQTTTADYGLF